MRAIYIKFLVFVMFFTGVVQLKALDFAWEYFRTIQAFHIIASLIITLFLVTPFIYQHIYKFFFIKKVNSINGWLLLLIFFLLTISGLYLFLAGNRGGDTFGIISFNVHLYGSFALILFFIYHVLQKQNVQLSVVAMLFTILNPALSHAATDKLSLIETDAKTGIYHNEDFTNSAKCKSCHEEIFNQWSNSNHYHMTGSNPYYMVMETLAGEVEGQEFRKWCMGCH
ncbi:MAG TPA: hypothetical protein CFH78_08170, partial [Sulfurimonas sp. UBA10385]